MEISLLFAREDNSRDPLTEQVIGAAIEVHRTLGPGLIESVYQQCLCYELSQRHVPFELQAPVRVRYKDVTINDALKIDILIPHQLVIELKAVEKVLPIHEAQLLTYLRLTGIHRGLLLNFNVLLMKDGIMRRVV